MKVQRSGNAGRIAAADFGDQGDQYMTKHLLFAAMAAVAMSAAHAGSDSCEAQATEKKLSGAARTSFVTKCDKDKNAQSAEKVCEAQAAEKKLAGAARTSFTQKCVRDATGAGK